MTRLRRHEGLTLIEVMWTLLIISIGVLATLATYSHFADATGTARRQAVLVSVAQREIEELRPISFSKLALSSPPSSQASTEAPLNGPAASEPVVSGNGGVVSPGGDPFTYRGAQGRIYRYVTQRTLDCSNLTAKVHSQLATEFGISVPALDATLPSLCQVGASTKRLTVVVVPLDKNGNALPGVRLSTVVQDPSGPVTVAGTNPTLALKPAVAAVASTPTPAAGSVKQTVYLTDTRCSDSTRGTPVDHQTRDTAQVAWTCASSGPAPNLLTLDPIPGSASDPVADFSTDITRAAGGGLALLRDNQGGSCSDTSNLVYQNPETDPRDRSIHKWATIPATHTIETPVSGGRASLTFWSSTATGDSGPARLCVTLQGQDGHVYGSTDLSLATWPGTATELTTAFDIDDHSLSNGQRMVLTLRVPQDSGNDIRILYDHATYPSSLSFTMQSGKTLP